MCGFILAELEVDHTLACIFLHIFIRIDCVLTEFQSSMLLQLQMNTLFINIYLPICVTKVNKGLIDVLKIH